MSKYSFMIPMCDTHHNDVAQALCRNHKKLLCLSCLVEREKPQECSVTELGKILEEKDTLLLKCLSVRQIATKKERLFKEHDDKTAALKAKLENEIIEVYEKLTKRLDEMKTNCLKSVDRNAKNITAGSINYKQKLVAVKTTVNEHINKLSTESVDDVSNVHMELDVIKNAVMTTIIDKDTIPEGNFKLDNRLGELMLQSSGSLGNIYMEDPELYETIDEEYINPLYATSDEIVYDKDDKPNITPTERMPDKKLDRISNWVSADKKKTDQDGGLERGWSLIRRLFKGKPQL
ncbi:uncharacterized protein LOC123529576 [Mercenaria mercenaria]|uniref:uncharacterized protein LOC123529576 n=1 Tax=Mercenaria mercenaria TaxID=6596 RepID=UPI00234F653B|nr:uncharacterized protein LOC123529576 [Mercenaria mercenaria]